ncbi:unnamed protein product [Moneuplotes crassus]|uniref:Uncharacterized protein n=1 Tax=Euplotes crassus TaxID=5936 RepID=A0AAD1XIG4_EUPCR|nr:unnamed protein product [Moneuplotes crassus]
MNISGSPDIRENSMVLKGMSSSIIRDKSPNRVKIAELAEKLNSTHLSTRDQEKLTEKESQDKLSQINNQINELSRASNTEIANIKEEAKRIEELISIEHKEKEILQEKYSKQFKIVQNSLEIQIQNEQYSLAHNTPEPSSNHSEKFYSLQLDLAKEKKVREETSVNFFHDVEDQINDLKSEIDYLNKSRAEAGEKLVKRLGQEINAFHQLLADERKKRKALHEKIINAVKDIQKRVYNEINIEKNAREETQESLVKILEDTVIGQLME